MYEISKKTLDLQGQLVSLMHLEKISASMGDSNRAETYKICIKNVNALLESVNEQIVCISRAVRASSNDSLLKKTQSTYPSSEDALSGGTEVTGILFVSDTLSADSVLAR